MNTNKISLFHLLIAASWIFAAGGTAEGAPADTFGTPAPGISIQHRSGPGTDLATVAGNGSVHHVITEAGSYYLSDDLEVSKPTGINIQAAGVTIDLNGFEVRRVSGSGGHGILIALTADKCTVKNGSVTGFAYGVRAFSEGGAYRQLNASYCAYAGLVGGTKWLIDSCRAENNAELDVLTGDGSTVVTRAASRMFTRTSEPAWAPSAFRGSLIHL